MACRCGAIFPEDSTFCNMCGTRRRGELLEQRAQEEERIAQVEQRAREAEERAQSTERQAALNVAWTFPPGTGFAQEVRWREVERWLQRDNASQKK